MFIFTAKLTRKKLAVAIGAVGALLIGIIVLLSGRGRVEASASTVPSPKGIKTAEARVEFLSGYEWTADISSEQCQEVVVPKTFDSAFEEYNNLQKEQGFDLSKYKGKRVKRFVYLISNHPSGKAPVYASVLIYKNTVIGGDIQNPALDGFMHGFDRAAPSLPQSE